MQLQLLNALVCGIEIAGFVNFICFQIVGLSFNSSYREREKTVPPLEELCAFLSLLEGFLGGSFL